MSANKYGGNDLMKHIDETYPDIDGAICAELRNDSAYSKMWQETILLQKEYPEIARIIEGEGDGAVTLTGKEHQALVRYLNLRCEMDNAERKLIYFRGHMDNTAYLKQMAGLHLD